MKTANGLTFILALALLVGLPIYLVNAELGAQILLAKRLAAGTVLVALLVGSYILLQDNNALRDSSELANNKPYSFARVQMWWWTIIVLGSFLGVYAVSGNQWTINATCLVLLGISSVTTAGARMIDNSQTNDAGVTRHQDRTPSKGLVRDILSDENGLSIHRFQAMIFNLAYGLSFLVEVFSKVHATDGAFPVYADPVLGLLGLSSCSYVYMKMNESQTATPPPQSATATPPVA
ncbi:MAG: hypothetical protein WC091_22100 [Sulfuricellaceae bacterium]